MLKKVILVSLLTCFSFAHAQTPMPISKNILQSAPKPNQPNNSVGYTPAQISQMDMHISKGEYQELFSFLHNNKVSKQAYIDYLLSKKHLGIIPLYWLISDFYANEKNELETHKWFYISLIMTQQDSYLCTDNTAKNAPRKLMEFFPSSVLLTRNTPHHIENAMRDVAFFISNLSTRMEPNWVCYYGDNPNGRNNKVVIDRKKWKDARQKVYNNFVAKYQK